MKTKFASAPPTIITLYQNRQTPLPIGKFFEILASLFATARLNSNCNGGFSTPC